MFKEFGNSSLNLTGRLWTTDVDKRRALLSELHHTIYQKLDEAGIVIAFPQLDVHLDPKPATTY